MALLLVFIAGRRYGTAEGIGVAVFFALVDAIFGEPDPLRLVLMAGSGPAAALGGILFKRHGQAGGFFLYLGLMAARWWGTAGMDGLLVTGLLTWAVILCLPAAAWEKMTLPLPLPANSPDHREKRRQEVVIERLQRLVELFNQIAAVFSGERGRNKRITGRKSTLLSRRLVNGIAVFVPPTGVVGESFFTPLTGRFLI